MAQATNQYKRTVSGSIGAGIGSVFGGSGRTYFILEHKSTSKYHRAGETQEIIVDQIELGREAKCQVRYDDSFGTVSRRHAAIYREGDRWKLVTLSETNSTLLNGQRIDSETYLQNGDEIQLSSGGPRLGFILPTGKKSTVGSIGLTRRLNLFRQQALTPYKRAIAALSVLLVLVIAGGIYLGMENQGLYQKLEDSENKLTALNQETTALLEKATSENYEEINSKLAVINKEKEDLQRKISAIQSQKNSSSAVSQKAAEAGSQEPSSSQQANQVSGIASLAACNQHVFAVFLDDMYYKVDPSAESVSLDISRSTFVGSGFMLDDGRFVTARHVVEPWYYYNYFGNEYMRSYYKLFNQASFNSGVISAKYTIISPTGKRYSITNEQFICNRSNDLITKEGAYIYRTSESDRHDWAFFQTSATSGLKYDNALCRGLTQGTSLDILGYPGGEGARDINNVSPIYSSCITSGDGLNADGIILSSNTDAAGGNSGGPVFVNKGGGFVVVGLITGHKQILGQKGVIVPISEVRR